MSRRRLAPTGLVRVHDSLLMRLAFVAAVLLKVKVSAATGGVGLAFSSFIVPALHDLPDAEAVAAMQDLTALAIPPFTWTVLLGTGVYAVGLVVADVVTRGRRASPWLVLATACYLVGVVGVTVFGTWRMDEWLHTLDSEALPVDAWMAYATAWVGFNNVRILAAGVSCGLCVIAMLRR